MSFLNLAFIERLAEERIKQAQDEGAFDALPGRGRPLALDDDAHVPEDLRMAWRVLKNADFAAFFHVFSAHFQGGSQAKSVRKRRGTLCERVLH